MAESVSVRLPAAPPGTYLRGMAYWHELERAMHEHPSVATLAATQGVPFFGDEVAEHISGILATALVEQASHARRAGSETVAPVLGGPAPLMSRVGDHLRRRTQWLRETKALRALGVQPPDQESVRLLEAAISEFDRQVRAPRPG